MAQFTARINNKSGHDEDFYFFLSTPPPSGSNLKWQSHAARHQKVTKGTTLDFVLTVSYAVSVGEAEDVLGPGVTVNVTKNLPNSDEPAPVLETQAFNVSLATSESTTTDISLATDYMVGAGQFGFHFGEWEPSLQWIIDHHPVVTLKMNAGTGFVPIWSADITTLPHVRDFVQPVVRIYARMGAVTVTPNKSVIVSSVSDSDAAFVFGVNHNMQVDFLSNGTFTKSTSF
jgi:hypothetical protein